MKFKIGDQVVVISIGADNGWAPSMDQYLHKTGTIVADYRADPAREFDYWDRNIKRYQVEFTLAKSSDLWWFPEDSLQLVTQNRHKQADLIHAWCEGVQIEYKCPETGLWFDWDSNAWNDELECRIKPEWWKNIPEHGILAKNIVGHYTGVLIGKPSNVEQWIPLTNEEIERFKR